MYPAGKLLDQPPCRTQWYMLGAWPLEFVDKAHVDVPGVLGGDAAHTCAACGAVSAPDILGLVKPQGNVVGFHHNLEVVVHLVGGGDAKFRGVRYRP